VKYELVVVDFVVSGVLTPSDESSRTAFRCTFSLNKLIETEPLTYSSGILTVLDDILMT